MQFHILSFEGPDPYSRAGGIATRVEGLARALADLGLETHPWFVGDPDLPGHEDQGDLHLHRWAQWVSRHHLRRDPREAAAVRRAARSTAHYAWPRIVERVLLPRVGVLQEPPQRDSVQS